MMNIKKEEFSVKYNGVNLKEKALKERKKWMWIILLGCFLLQMLPYCVALNLTNVFVGSDWAFWTNGNNTFIGLTFTMGAVGAAFAGPFVAKMFGKKINMRFVYSMGVIVAMIGFVGSSINGMIPENVRTTTTAVAILWLSNITSQIGVMIFSGLGVNNLISKWWPPEKRGFALGLAFTGGSLGNIWMQQLVGELSKIFNNIPDSQQIGGYHQGSQYATYLIMGAIGLVLGLMVVMFVCRKPLPPVDIMNLGTTPKDKKSINGNILLKDAQVKLAPALEASPLNTKKYPIYWILAFGYLILQMGTVHAAFNGSFVINSTIPGMVAAGEAVTKDTYASIMAVGGTLFGVSCLIGNFGGGMLNDRLGPNKSIFLAGTLQCVAIFCLMYSAKISALIYVYFILAGLSVFVYTSTPSFISGRLYGAGQSNNHMAILGIFIALGFAIVNSITGSITGPTGKETITTSDMFGVQTTGNFFALGIFGIVCMAIGTIIVSICCTIIMNKGIKGLLDYSPTKYTKVILLKHSLSIKFAALRILLTKKDFRKNPNRITRMESKKLKDESINAIDDFKKLISNNFTKDELATNEKNILAQIYLCKLITLKELELFTGIKNVDKIIATLVSKKLIVSEDLQASGLLYKISDKLKTSLSSKTSNQWFFDKLETNYSKINKENINIDNILSKLNEKQIKKLAKINAKIEKEKLVQIDQDKQNKLTEKSKTLVEKLETRKVNLMDKASEADEWKKYKIEYASLEKIHDARSLSTKLVDTKQAKMVNLQKKIGIAGYVSNFDKKQQIVGHDMLVNYYNNTWETYDNLIEKRVNDRIEHKLDNTTIKLNNIQTKLNKLNIKKQTIDAEIASN